MGDNYLIVGATSGIASALCRVLAERGCSLILAGRSPQRLQKLEAELRPVAAGSIHLEMLDVLDFPEHAEFVQRCARRFDGVLNGAVICVGHLPDQERVDRSQEELRRTVDVNFTAVASLVALLAECMAERNSGIVAAVSSVAGDRPRASSYAYAAAKAALNTFLEGLRGRMLSRGVSVLTIKPGWVATRMTEGIVDPHSWMVASPDTVARQIEGALRRRRSVVYTPRRWRAIMFAVRLIPEFLFRRMRV